MDEMIEMENDLTQGAGEVEIVDDSADESVAFDEYFISSYGLDFDVEGIVRRYQRGDIEVPGFQRGYIWTKPQASRFVESLLLGLPVPGIFLYREDDTRKLTVIDGQQRIRTLDYFCKGTFGDGKPFKLRGLSPESRFSEAGYDSLVHEDRRKLNDSVIHATIIRQEKPEDDGSSKYFVFERLNTGGTWLLPQEIRSAIYAGNFCELLAELNKNESWRKLFGKPHKRKRDEELILRFFALYYDYAEYGSSMVGFLNEFMKRNQTLSDERKQEFQYVFCSTTKTILEKLGERAFRLQTTLNAALLDSTMVGVAKRLEGGKIRECLTTYNTELLKDPEYLTSVTERTSRKERVNTRIKMAINAFADAE